MPTGKDILVMSYRLSTFLYGSIVPEIEVQIHAFLYQKRYGANRTFLGLIKFFISA